MKSGLHCISRLSETVRTSDARHDPDRIEKLKLIAEEMQIAFHMAMHLTDPFLTRMRKDTTEIIRDKLFLRSQRQAPERFGNGAHRSQSELTHQAPSSLSSDYCSPETAPQRSTPYPAD